MKKKLTMAVFLIAILTVILAISLSATEPVETWDISATENDSVTAYLYADPQNEGEYSLTVSGTGNMKKWTLSSSVPWHSYTRSKITSVTIENGITFISEYAFYNFNALTSIVIPNSVSTIDNYAFRYCDALTIYAEAKEKPSEWEKSWNFDKLPTVWDCTNNNVADDGYIYEVIDKIKYGIRDGYAIVAPQPRNIVEISIPTSITYNEQIYYVQAIGNNAFNNCASLKNVFIPNSITTIGKYGFGGCTSLTNIEIPNSVADIGKSAFSGCKGLASFVIPNSITSISDYTFSNCTGLTSINIPNSVTAIGGRAFSNCSRLTSITIPGSITSIEAGAFYNCKSLQSIQVEESNEHFCTIDGSLYSKDKKVLLQYAFGLNQTSFVIPHTVEIIGESAFELCYKLTSVTITSNVTTIKNSAFKDMIGITSITIPKNVKIIGENAFSLCENLTNVIIENGVEEIGKNAFFMGYVKKIFIPSSVTSIGSQAFYWCPGPLYAEAVSKPQGWDNDWDIITLPSINRIKVIWGHTHQASTNAVNNGDTHTGICVCGLGVTEEHIYGAWAELDETTKVRECICGETDYLVIEKEDDKVNVKPSTPDKDKSKDKVKIDIVFNEEVFNEIGIEIIPEILEQINGMETEINTDLGSVILDAIASSKVAGANGSVSIGVADITTDSEEKTGHRVFSITVNDENGNPILPPERDDNGTVTLSLKYQKGLVKEQIKIAYRDESGKLEYMEVERYDPETGEVTFKTSHLSDYVIYAEALEVVYIEQIFTFKGYSFGPSSSFAIGFDIDYKALNEYKTLTENELEIGVVFAGYDNLAGKQPLDEYGRVIKLERGIVVKADLSSYSYSYYDFIFTDINESIKDIELVISAYIFDKERVMYVQENGISDTVYGISYNKAKESMSK